VWLREHGYCVYQERAPAQQKDALGWILQQWSHNHKGWSGRPEKLLRRLIQAMVPRLPKDIQSRFWANIEKAIPFAESHVRFSTTPDFNRTAVFPGSLYSGLLYFNVADREPNGVIPAQDRKSLAFKLRDELYEIREPETGERLFTNIFLSDELFYGAAADDAPDLILDAFRSQWNIRSRQPAPHTGEQHSRYFITFDRSRDFGWHSPDGVFVFSGPAFRPGRSAQVGSLLDVPATLLHIYDTPMPTDWDGRVLHELLNPELSQRPIRTQPGDTEPTEIDENAYSPEEADALFSHLRALGYLD
jgi:hypothetical protein